MNTKVIFCTSYVDSDPQRYQNWINYYTEYFKDDGIDLWMINDGPCQFSLDLKGVQFRSFEERLGRISVWIFPGWKRSFFHALRWLTPQYSQIGHIESDCWLTPLAKPEFLYHLNQEGYYTGYAKAYSFPEAALQILNSRKATQYILDKYSCTENWYEDIDFERDLERLEPTYILDGDRIENEFSRFNKKFTFVTGTTYQDYQRYYA